MSNLHRKYCITFTHGERNIIHIPIELPHSNVNRTILGGYIYITDNFVLFYGESEEFGKPSLEHFNEIFKTSGWQLYTILSEKEIRFSDSLTLEEALFNYTIVNGKIINLTYVMS